MPDPNAKPLPIGAVTPQTAPASPTAAVLIADECAALVESLVKHGDPRTTATIRLNLFNIETRRIQHGALDFLATTHRAGGDAVGDLLRELMLHRIAALTVLPVTATFVDLVVEECTAIRSMLLRKNAAYGDSALNPLRIFSSASPLAQIEIRIDDKLSRLQRGSAAGEDTLLDLIGYLILYRVAKRMQGGEL